MIVDRYYYNQLNKVEKVIYKAFYEGVMAHQDIIPIPVKGNLSQEVFTKIFSALTRDNPLIYYLNQSACKFAQDALGHIAICPQYFFSKEKIKVYNRKIEQKVNELAAHLHLTEGTDYDKALKVHDWLCQNVTYDQQGHDMSDPVRVIMTHNIIGVFAHKCAQCEGIAKAVKVLLNAVDVKCIVATGMANSKKEMGPHAWNVVNLNGTPYHMDVTWDIGAVNKNMSSLPYDYFNVSDELIYKDHKADCKLPVCGSLEMNYFTKNKLVFSSKHRLLAYMEKRMNMGEDEYCFRLEGKLNNPKSMEMIRDFLVKRMQDKRNTPLRIQCVMNEGIGIGWIKIV